MALPIGYRCTPSGRMDFVGVDIYRHNRQNSSGVKSAPFDHRPESALWD